MVVIAGCAMVIICVLTGFSMAGGHMHSLIHPSEIVTIGGAAMGGLIIMSPTKVIKDLIKGLVQTIKGSPFNKAMYLELFRLLNSVGRLIRRDGLLAMESHLSNPKESAIFQASPRILANHHVLDFIVGALNLILDSGTPNLHALLEEDIKVIEREHHAAAGALSKTADALPGFGIVAAVLGIVVTMGAIGGPVEEIGHKVGAALVGTFLGILLSYGFFGPLAGRLEHLGEEEATFFRVIAGAVVSISEGARANDVVSRACRSVGTGVRPSHAELTELLNEK